MKYMKTKIFFLFAFGIFFIWNSEAFANTQIILRGGNLSDSDQFRTIAVSEGLELNKYYHYGNTAGTAAKLCALTEKYYNSLGLDKPYPIYVGKTATTYASCWNDYNHVWKTGGWVTEGACKINSYLQSVTCESLSVACSQGSDCGINGYVNSPFCQGSNIYQDFKTYTCNNPGTASSTCSSSTVPQQKQTCSLNQTCQGGQCVSHPPSADLSIYKSGPATVNRGGVVVYSVIVTNNGPSAVTGGYTIGDTIPNQTVFNSDSSTSGCSMYPGRPDLATCSESSVLASGANRTFTLAFNVPNNVACNTVLDNVAAVNSGIPDPNTANNHSSIVQGGPVRTTVVCPPPPAPTCSTNTDCGTNTYEGSPFCQGNSVYRNFRTYICNNPGLASSFCSNSVSQQLLNNCGANQTCTNGSCVNQNIVCASNAQCGTDGPVSGLFCKTDGNVYQKNRTFVCNNPNTVNSSCSYSDADQLKNNCTGTQTCSNGSCINQNITCSTNAQCGTNTYEGSPFCQGNSVYRNFRTYICNNPGLASSFCSSSVSSQLLNNCASNQTCQNETCQNNQNNLVVSCYVAPNSANTNQSVSFIATATGGTGSYGYLWTGACAGFSQVCNNSFSQPGIQTATVNVYSGSQTTTAACSVSINQACASRSYQQCSGNYLYWYNSCGNREDNYQYCQYGCSGNSCSQSSCSNYNARKCVGNSVYWYDSCGNQQGLFQVCSGVNQVCLSGQCIVYYNPAPPPAPAPTPLYIKNYTTSCYNNNLYWFDSLGKAQTLYKNCADENQCTEDTCSGSKCRNLLKCDGATCAIDSNDYNKYCAPIQPVATNFSITVFGKKDINAVSWDKMIQVGPNANIYFLAVIKNNSNAPADNVNVSANIPNEVSLIGNLRIDDIPTSGDIVSGINIGSISANGTKTITFEGKTRSFATAGDKQATINISAGGTTQLDALTISLNLSQLAAVSSASAESGFIEFIKRWYIWILVAIVLMFLFIVIFRRLSTNV